MSAAVRHPVFARVYAALIEAGEATLAEHRDALLAGLAGRVIEVGAGTGVNFRHHPAGVSEVVAVEPEPHLRRRAEAAAAQAEVPVTVRDGVAESLPAGDGEFDAAVCSLVLCSVGGPAAALAEIRRVLRPGGELRFFEHVVSVEPRVAAGQRALSPLWSRACGGCRPDRDTLAAIEAAGFEIQRYRRLRLVAWPGDLPIAPHVLGSARRP